MITSAGILLHRQTPKGHEVLLVHPGGPYWAKKDNAAWSIPKGQVEEGEAIFTAAKREFLEELGSHAPRGDYTPLKPVKYGNKTVHIFALNADFDLSNFKSNNTLIEWPPRSGRAKTFPENDKAMWFPVLVAQQKIVKGQLPIIQQLATML